MNPSYPLGVDILERKKALSFYRNHHQRLGELLCPAELALVEASRKPAETFALIFSAKEAVFKSLGAPWMGPSGFRQIRILPEKNFSFRLSGELKKNFSLKTPFRVSFKKKRDYIVAACHPRSTTLCAGT